jgi:hypothetical protein
MFQIDDDHSALLEYLKTKQATLLVDDFMKSDTKKSLKNLYYCLTKDMVADPELCINNIKSCVYSIHNQSQFRRQQALVVLTNLLKSRNIPFNNVVDESLIDKEKLSEEEATALGNIITNFNTNLLIINKTELMINSIEKINHKELIKLWSSVKVEHLDAVLNALANNNIEVIQLLDIYYSISV